VSLSRRLQRRAGRAALSHVDLAPNVIAAVCEEARFRTDAGLAVCADCGALIPPKTGGQVRVFEAPDGVFGAELVCARCHGQQVLN
jgi:hypothetical protein